MHVVNAGPQQWVFHDCAVSLDSVNEKIHQATRLRAHTIRKVDATIKHDCLTRAPIHHLSKPLLNGVESRPYDKDPATGGAMDEHPS